MTNGNVTYAEYRDSVVSAYTVWADLVDDKLISNNVPRTDVFVEYMKCLRNAIDHGDVKDIFRCRDAILELVTKLKKEAEALLTEAMRGKQNE